MSMRKDFCAFILSHGRPDRVHTYKTLMKAGYTGKVFIVIDDEDEAADKYRKLYGDKVLQFCKADYAAKLDEGDNTGKRISTIYARAAMFDLAPLVGCKYFIQLDDDYTDFSIRFNSHGDGCRIKIKHIDDVFAAFLHFLINTPALTICMGQTGELIGGTDQSGGNTRKLRRKAMNSFFCDVSRPWVMVGRMNEDVNTYIVEGRRGKLFFTSLQVLLSQIQTQANAGGMSELYLDFGTYVKSFYTVMYAPSCAKIGTLGDFRSPHFRIHHKINWHHAVPKILREKYKKGDKVSQDCGMEPILTGAKKPRAKKQSAK